MFPISENLFSIAPMSVMIYVCDNRAESYQSCRETGNIFLYILYILYIAYIS